MRRFLPWAALLCMTLLVAACAGSVPEIEVGAIAPEVRLDDISGDPVTLSELKGQVVLLNFWALWCEPCKAELPDFQAALERYGTAGLAVVTVDLGDRREEVKAFIGERGYSFVTLVDPGLTVRKSYDTRVLPLSLLIDREGIVRYQRVTPFEPGQLSAKIEALLGTSVASLTLTPTAPPSRTPTPTHKPSPTASRTVLPSPTPSDTASPTASATPSPTPTKPTSTGTARPSPTRTATPSSTATPTATPVPPTPPDSPVPSPTGTPAPSATPIPTETTVPPVYGVALTGETDKIAYPEVWVEFLGELLNTGNSDDTFLIGLHIQPRGWEAKYCIGPACYDYTVPSMPVTVPAGGDQAVSVKLKPPADAQDEDYRIGRLRATSLSDPSVAADWQVKAVVDIP